MSLDAPIRILLVDDHEIVRVGLKKALEADSSLAVIAEAATAKEALEQVSGYTPDLVLMDVRLEEGDGIQACREILAAFPTVRVLFLTSFADDDTILAAVLAGAHGFCVKRMDVGALIRSIKRVAAGEMILESDAVERMVAWVRNSTKESASVPPSDEAALSCQEQRILALVAEGKTNKEIAQDMNLSPNTVKNYLSNAFQKLQITRRTQAIALLAKRSRL